METTTNALKRRENRVYMVPGLVANQRHRWSRDVLLFASCLKIWRSSVVSLVFTSPERAKTSRYSKIIKSLYMVFLVIWRKKELAWVRAFVQYSLGFSLVTRNGYRWGLLFRISRKAPPVFLLKLCRETNRRSPNQAQLLTFINENWSKLSTILTCCLQFCHFYSNSLTQVNLTGHWELCQMQTWYVMSFVLITAMRKQKKKS